ncbi:MAG: hypothetical protein PWP64_1390 [Candidatus Cloacimonadota bacterium]|nr:hypothetical protein [Candidatus Cloacimonadota bacterium]
MKKFVITCIAACILFAPIIVKAELSNDIDISSLPEYTGDINNPDCLVIHRTDKILVVEIDGKYYFYILK